MKNFIICILITVFSINMASAEEDPPKPPNEQSCTNIKTLPLDSGKKIFFHGFLLRFTNKCWYLPLKKGKQLHIKISDDNESSAIVIYKPGVKIVYGSGDLSFLRDNDEDPANTYHGIAIKEAPEDGDAREVNLNIEKTGNYLMVIGLSRGPSSVFNGVIQMK